MHPLYSGTKPQILAKHPELLLEMLSCHKPYKAHLQRTVATKVAKPLWSTLCLQYSQCNAQGSTQNYIS